MKIEKEYLEKIGAIKNGHEYKLRIGATYITLRFGGEKCYCELPGLYVGEITKERLSTLYHGLTGLSIKSESEMKNLKEKYQTFLDTELSNLKYNEYGDIMPVQRESISIYRMLLNDIEEFS